MKKKKPIDKVFAFEDKLHNWIKNNRFIWITFLFFFGVFIAVSTSIFLKLQTEKAVVFSIVSGLVFVIIELLAGGSGVE